VVKKGRASSAVSHAILHALSDTARHYNIYRRAVKQKKLRQRKPRSLSSQRKSFGSSTLDVLPSRLRSLTSCGAHCHLSLSRWLRQPPFPRTTLQRPFSSRSRRTRFWRTGKKSMPSKSLSGNLRGNRNMSSCTWARRCEKSLYLNSGRAGTGLLLLPVFHTMEYV
jgi:hypothetical protein